MQPRTATSRFSEMQDALAPAAGGDTGAIEAFEQTDVEALRGALLRARRENASLQFRVQSLAITVEKLQQTAHSSEQDALQSAIRADRAAAAVVYEGVSAARFGGDSGGPFQDSAEGAQSRQARRDGHIGDSSSDGAIKARGETLVLVEGKPKTTLFTLSQGADSRPRSLSGGAGSAEGGKVEPGSVDGDSRVAARCL